MAKLKPTGENTTMAISAVNVTTAAAEIVAPKYSRKLLIIQNVSDADVFLKLDSSATEVTTGNGLKLAVGSAPVVIASNPGEFTNAIRAIHGSSGNKEVRVTEE
jgi:hypothetical protein